MVVARWFEPGERVRIRRPRELDGLIGLVLRQVDGGVEVQFVGDGTPLTVVVHPRHLDPLAPAPERQVPVLEQPDLPAASDGLPLPARHRLSGR